jgi:ABC-2 type transport system ATP-binding protein
VGTGDNSRAASQLLWRSRGSRVIEAQHLTKRYGQKLAVDDLTFVVEAGLVTGFVGPNGSGKSTTMRMIVGLDAPSAGQVTVDGRTYGNLRFPLRAVGTSLDANAMHPGRSARNHLMWLADSNAIPRTRVDEVLGMVGMIEVGERRAGALSLGMGQRLGIAAALLGDPGILLFDEPINGLDPEGILWVRQQLRQLASEGRTILVSSHLMSEMALTADQLIVIGRGRLLAAGRVADFIEQTSGHRVRVLASDAAILATLLRHKGATVTVDGNEGLTVTGLDARDVGIVAAGADLTLYELSTERASLEDAFLELTRDHTEFRTGMRAEGIT